MKNTFRSSLLLTITVLLLTACSKLTMENYDTLKMGMTLKEAEAIIGGADECTEKLGAMNCYWGNKDGKHINIKFVAGNAVMFSHEGLD